MSVATRTTPQEMAWHLRHFSVFEHFDRNELEAVTRILRVQEYSRREPVFLPGRQLENVYFLLAGRVKVTRIDAHTGKELILFIVRPAEIFGLLAGAHGERTNSAFALQRSLVGYVPRGDFERMTQQKEFVTELNRLAGERLVKVTNRLEEMVFRDVPSRLASLLLRLADEFPAQRNGRRVIDVRLTQQDLADLIGATRETTSIAINDFRRRGLLDAGRGSITILSPDGLAALAD